MKIDLSIEQIRKVGHQISAQFDHDPKQLIQYYIELQEKYHSRIIESPPQFQSKDTERVDKNWKKGVSGAKFRQ